MRWLAIILATIPRLASAGNFYAGTSPANIPWPGGTVPYEFTNTLTTAQKQTYLDGLREWELAANVKFIPHTSQTHWILFTYNTNGFDNVSATTNPQVVSVSSLSRAQVGHEMGHSFGFTHENIRPDQANFLTVLSNNVTSGNLQFFQIDATSVTNGSYDFESVMHLGWDFASTNPGVTPTQQPKPPYFLRYQFRMGNLCLSPGDRAALKFLYGSPAVPLTSIVTNTADAGPGSLRAAMYYAADHPGATVSFNIPTSDPGYSNGVFNLHLTGHLPPLATNGMVIDGSTQPGFTSKPLIVVDGSQIIPETFTPNSGLLIYSANNQVKNISFTGFNWNGLTLLYADATNNTIAGCWVGLNSSGTNAAPNAFQGILIANGASRNVIGGTNALARNVLSGNTQYGLILTDTNTTGNNVLGNYFGTGAAGTNAVPNLKSGVLIGSGANGNIIGSTNVAGRNLLSGNVEFGVFITDSNTTGNVVLGNLIGPDASGNQAVANGLGGLKIVSGAHNNLVGGSTLAARNIVSGNTDTGIRVEGTANNTVQGNYVGLNAAGNTALPNGFTGMYLYAGAQSNLVLNNVFSGNPSEGLRLYDVGTSFNLIQGNYFGTDATGSNAVANGFAGVTLFAGATANTIGGTTTAARNVISGNTYGMVVGDPGTSGNFVQGNFIGLNAGGKNALANSFAGVAVWNGATSNLFGGTVSSAANVVSANTTYGFYITDTNTSGNLVQGNLIGTDITGTNAQGNGFVNVVLSDGASGNVIGGTNAGAGNVIAFGGTGVALYNAGTTNNSIRGNSIFSSSGLGIDFSNDGVTPNDLGDADTGPNNAQNFPVITNAFGYGTSTIVLGNLNSATNRSFSIDVYRSVAAGFGGYGPGQFYVGTVSAATDGNGNTKFALTNTAANYAGQFFTATATSANGDTSEFSLAVLATNAPAPSAAFIAPFNWRTNGFSFNLSFTTNFNYRIQATTNLIGSPVPWVDLTNFIATNSSITFTDRAATNFRTRFYRVVSP
jgi:hypothetical protein